MFEVSKDTQCRNPSSEVRRGPAELMQRMIEVPSCRHEDGIQLCLLHLTPHSDCDCEGSAKQQQVSNS